MMKARTHIGLQSGFSLIELMTVVSIVAVMAAISAPSFSAMLKTLKVKTVADDLFVDMTLARSEAIKRKVNVSLVPKDTSASKDWAKGWDVTSTQMVGTTSTAITIKTKDTTAGNVTTTGASNSSIVFGSAGRLVGSTTTLKLQVKQTDLDSSAWRCVSVDFSGRAASAVGACS